MVAKRFIDLFAGCGGLSLGLRRAGWNGVFAVEAHADAFETYRHNHLRTNNDWPEWLPLAPMRIEQLISDHRSNLESLEGTIDLVAGGPPCQGFSTAGRRRQSDPRNELVSYYLDFLRIVRPRIVLLENVRGFMTMRHEAADSYADYVEAELESLGYQVWSELLTASDWGVPQRRPRFFVIAALGDDLQGIDPFLRLKVARREFLKNRTLPIDREVSVGEAIDDLRTTGALRRPCHDGGVGGFEEIEYTAPPNPTGYLSLMRAGATKQPNGLRLPRHSAEVTQRFEQIQSTCKKGRPLTVEDRNRLNMKKRSLTPLSSHQPSSTVTTLPDDIIHYSEPRILTVRECARLQSFPDTFEFCGPYTTGGPRRGKSCPRYTQVGNAVPPLLAEAIGEILLGLEGNRQDVGKVREVVEMSP